MRVKRLDEQHIVVCIQFTPKYDFFWLTPYHVYCIYLSKCKAKVVGSSLFQMTFVFDR